MSFSLDVAIEGESSNVSLSFVGMEFAIQDDYPIEKLSDLVDYTYYAEANMIGDLSCESIFLTQRRGRGKTEYEFPTAHFRTYVTGGDIYLDLSEIDLSDLGVETNKYVFRDGFAALKSEDAQQIRDLLSIPELDMQALLSASTENEVIENAIHMERYDRERYNVSFELNSSTIAEVVGYFDETAKVDEVKAQIDEFVTFGAGTAITALYNMKDNSVSGFGLVGTLGLPIGSLEYEETSIDLSNTKLNVDLNMVWNSSEAFALPPLDDYTEVTIPKETESTSEVGSSEAVA